MHKLTPLLALAILRVVPAVLASPIALADRDLNKRYTGVKIQANRDGLCLHAFERTPIYDGTPVLSIDCEVAALWDINPGSGSVLFHYNNKYALDAGSSPSNWGNLKLWTSYPGLFQQTWYLTDDKRIAITGGDQCLDESPDRSPQTWRCGTGNTNQIWSIVGADTGGGGGGGSGGSGGGSGPIQDPPNGGNRIHPQVNSAQCVTVLGGSASAVAAVQITDCFPNDSPYAPLQFWDLPTGRPGHSEDFVKLHNYPTLCLTTGNGYPNAGGLIVAACVTGKVEQLWDVYQGQFQLGYFPNRQCLDVRRESNGGGGQPYSYAKDLQTWSCSDGNPQQQFFINP